ncbi:TetR/AcrR family transcriptional regulator [Amycolatopsis nigrescens]|uniref:TetR/AcrR family transcriptional regulator n=1 Tax=Amycolatopsis nigrescens TaxID=381445 RepID=UPI00037AB866|nr:TetR/AcrR family transcriptional regulator [Amycolatopsis nigrescens]
MGRPPTHTADTFLDSAAALFAEQGARAVTMSAVARHSGAPSGSVYHRFPDRPALLSSLWVRTVSRFHQGFFVTLETEPATEAAIAAATHAVAWCREHPQEGHVLYAGKRAFSPEEWSGPAVKECAKLDDALEAVINGLLARLRPLAREDVLLALIDLPYAVVRRYLTVGRIPPKSSLDLVERTARKLLTGGSRPA